PRPSWERGLGRGGTGAQTVKILKLMCMGFWHIEPALTFEIGSVCASLAGHKEAVEQALQAAGVEIDAVHTI
ncbi:MAG: hypothetical protein JXB47_18545, partial [Anaerolineae bacterium]|nr:hypothetical protein [Anaerolineae bacterium]